MTISYYLIVSLLAFNNLQFNEAAKFDKQPIFNGYLVKPGEIKYIVATLHDDSWYGCGGGIIDDFFILTAAHCFFNDNNKIALKKITVVAGTNDLYNEDDPRRIEVDVEKLYIPDSYDHSQFPNDIAVLKLKKSLNIKKNDLQKLLLPTKARGNLTDRVALIAGFGFDKYKSVKNKKTEELEGEGSTSGRLRKADVKIFDNAECQKLYEEEIYDSYLCGKMVKDIKTKTSKYGVCNGDSGSPLVYNSKVLLGVVAWSHGCDERKVPLVYTRVTNYLSFIKNAMNDKTDHMIYKVFK